MLKYLRRLWKCFLLTLGLWHLGTLLFQLSGVIIHMRPQLKLAKCYRSPSWGVGWVGGGSIVIQIFSDLRKTTTHAHRHRTCYCSWQEALGAFPQATLQKAETEEWAPPMSDSTCRCDETTVGQKNAMLSLQQIAGIMSSRVDPLRLDDLRSNEKRTAHAGTYADARNKARIVACSH